MPSAMVLFPTFLEMLCWKVSPDVFEKLRRLNAYSGSPKVKRRNRSFGNSGNLRVSTSGTHV